MSVESATYISGLDSTRPTGADPKSEGDDHLRLLKSTIKATFPNVAGAVTPTHTEINYVDGVTSSIQTQLDGKVAQATFPNVGGTVTPTHTELNYVDGVTSALQTQLDGKLAIASYLGGINWNVQSATIADDATQTFNGLTAVGASEGNLFILFVDSGVQSQALFLSGIGQQVAVGVGSKISLGGSANPDVDTNVNIWVDGSGFIRIKNRLGASNTFHLIQIKP